MKSAHANVKRPVDRKAGHATSSDRENSEEWRIAASSAGRARNRGVKSTAGAQQAAHGAVRQTGSWVASHLV